jgi:hypothetical protein
MENLQKEPSGSPTNAQAALKKNTRVIAFWFFALVAGGFLGWLQIGWLNELFGFIATVFTRLFKFVAVPVIALAVITTLSQLGAKRETSRSSLTRSSTLSPRPSPRLSSHSGSLS